MYSFTYLQATSMAVAGKALEDIAGSSLLAGGQTLIPTLKQRLAAPSALVDISRIADLNFIRQEGENVVIGAVSRHADVAGSPLVRELIPGLAELAGMIGDPQVRHRGTIGGSVANNDPSADYPAACLGLGATLITNRRSISADAFFTGLFETALEEGEILAAVSFPIPAKMAYVKFPNPASRYAMVGVCAALGADGPRVAVTGSGAAGVFRWREAEEALAREYDELALQGLELDPAGLSSDIHAQADYRASLIAVMTRRAVRAANAK